MKKLVWIVLIILLVGGLVAAWVFLGPGTGFKAKTETLYIPSSGATKASVLDSLEANNIVSNTTAFTFLAGMLDYWEKIRPGRYEIQKGSSVLSIVRKLRNGAQDPVNLTITKLRTKEDFARLTGSKFEFDSLQMISFLNNADSLQTYQTDTASVLWNVVPDTYSFLWSTSPAAVYKRLAAESQKFWSEEREAKAKAIGLSPKETYILASIIEEETTNHKEKDTIASVYLNRLKIGMPLQADPTLKFAARNFALKRIAGPILQIASPYNTYRNKGLPPGPISTPSKVTIDAVLNPAQTPFLYFVANSRLNGHLFSTTFDEHLQKARGYWQEDRRRVGADSTKQTGG
ncbi:endolytic transglycosylase MltG [Flavisolibacter sp. BT320]|nr:endolytic transglycosylase MltG [Flavisolibacter longurius]